MTAESDIQPGSTTYHTYAGEVVVDGDGQTYPHPVALGKSWTRITPSWEPGFTYDTNIKWYINGEEVTGPLEVRIQTEDEAKVLRSSQLDVGVEERLCEHISRLQEYLNNYRLTIYTAEDSEMHVDCAKCGGHITVEDTRHKPSAVSPQPEVAVTVDEAPPVVQKFNVLRYRCKAGHEFVAPVKEGVPGPMIVSCQNEVGGTPCTELATKVGAGVKSTVKYEGPIVS